VIVVADSSPVNYLVLIDEIDVLAHLFGAVIIPGAVASELGSDDAPDIVRKGSTMRLTGYELLRSMSPSSPRSTNPSCI